MTTLEATDIRKELPEPNAVTLSHLMNRGLDLYRRAAADGAIDTEEVALVVGTLLARECASIQQAWRALTYSEQDALRAVLDRAEPGPNLLVLSKIADETGSTRSVFVSAMSKLEGAGILTSQSLGMKGTNINIPQLAYDELQRLSA